MKTNYVSLIFSGAAIRIGRRVYRIKKKHMKKVNGIQCNFDENTERIRACVYCVTFINVENSSAGHLAFFIVSFARRFVIDPFRVLASGAAFHNDRPIKLCDDVPIFVVVDIRIQRCFAFFR